MARKGFVKGDSRINKEGRPKGAINRLGADLRGDIIEFLTENFDSIKDDFAALKSPRDRIKLFIDLLQYGLPRLQAIELTDDIDRLNDNQVDELYNKIMKIYTDENKTRDNKSGVKG